MHRCILLHGRALQLNNHELSYLRNGFLAYAGGWDEIILSKLFLYFVCNTEKELRPLDQEEHALWVDELLHLDFIFTVEYSSEKQGFLRLKDAFSAYVYLRSLWKAGSTSTACALMEYFSQSVPVLKWCLDHGSHFCNEVLEILASTLVDQLRFSTVYEPWTNGSAETTWEEVLCVLHAMNVELRVPKKNCFSIFYSIQSIINNSLYRHLYCRPSYPSHQDTYLNEIRKYLFSLSDHGERLWNEVSRWGSLIQGVEK